MRYQILKLKLKKIKTLVAAAQILHCRVRGTTVGALLGGVHVCKASQALALTASILKLIPCMQSPVQYAQSLTHDAQES